jgi:hypothetical protein
LTLQNEGGDQSPRGEIVKKQHAEETAGWQHGAFARRQSALRDHHGGVLAGSVTLEIVATAFIIIAEG